MRERRQARPQLESLESMTLLSGMAAMMPIHAEVSTTTGTALTLTGTEKGVFLAHTTKTAKNYAIDTAGTLSPIGRAAITGSLQVARGISSGPPSGTLHLITAKGTLTLQIPQSVALPGGLPTATGTNEIVDTYVITKGTGAYKGDTGSGVVEFTFNPAGSFGAFQIGRVNITFTTLLTPTPV